MKGGIGLALVATTIAGCGSTPHAPAPPGRPAPPVIRTGQVLGMAVGPDGVWAAAHREGVVRLIDPRTNRVARTVRVGDSGSQPGDPDVAAGALWVPLFQGGRLQRVDLRTGAVTTALRGTFWQAAAGYGSVWLLEWRGQGPGWTDWNGRTVTRLDPRSGKVTARIAVRGGARNLAAGEGGVWVVSQGAVDRIDPRTNRITARVRVAPAPEQVRVGEGRVWVTCRGGALAGIDPRRLKQTARIHTGTDAQYLDVGDGAVWVGNVNDISDSTLARVDPARARVTRTIPVADGPQGLVVGFGSVWVGSFEDGTVTRYPTR